MFLKSLLFSQDVNVTSKVGSPFPFQLWLSALLVSVRSLELRRGAIQRIAVANDKTDELDLSVLMSTALVKF